ncbi:hypothetical protein [Pseudomonas sp. Marseille-QA0892]
MTKITCTTGIADAMVAGYTLDIAEVAAFAGKAALEFAPNAGFDRRFAKRLSDVFTTKPCAYTMPQIDWTG